jgi:hypothetical protein
MFQQNRLRLAIDRWQSVGPFHGAGAMMLSMKYVAIVSKVAVRGIHKLATIQDGDVRPLADLPDPHRVEIELDGSEAEACMMYRYTADGRFCGDTWHPSFEDAIEQAKYEYGLGRADFKPA